MKQAPDNINPALIRLAWLAIGGFLLLNIGLAFLRLVNKPFNPDELQHLHIAWLIAQGKIVYRDFWEHHGPLYSLFNGALIHLFNAEPTVRILLSSILSVLAAGGMLAQSFASTPFSQTDLMRQQKDFTNHFVSMTDRQEPVAVIWSLCGGYMFNENSGFYWVAIPFHSEIIEIISGEHPFRE